MSPIWARSTPCYSRLTTGDIDNDKRREIVGISGRLVNYYENFKYKYEYFIDIFKENEVEVGTPYGAWISSSLPHNKISLFDDDNFIIKGLSLKDIDADNQQEILAITSRQIGVFKVDRNQRKLNELLVVNPKYKGIRLLLRSLLVEDIDGDGRPEIIVSANRATRVRWDYSTYLADDVPGLLFVYSYSQNSLFLKDVLSVDAFLLESLRAGNLYGDKNVELLATGFRKNGGLYQGYLFIWDLKNSKQPREIVLGKPGEERNYNYLDVGNIDKKTLCEEIILYQPALGELSINRLGPDGMLLSEQKMFIVDREYFFSIWGLRVVSWGSEANNKCILAFGVGTKDDAGGRCYLEVFDRKLNSRFLRIGGESTEMMVAAIADEK